MADGLVNVPVKICERCNTEWKKDAGSQLILLVWSLSSRCKISKDPVIYRTMKVENQRSCYNLTGLKAYHQCRPTLREATLTGTWLQRWQWSRRRAAEWGTEGQPDPADTVSVRKFDLGRSTRKRPSLGRCQTLAAPETQPHSIQNCQHINTEITRTMHLFWISYKLL